MSRDELTSMRILIAEDDPVSRRVLQAHLNKWGYEVVVTHNGREAWQALEQENAPQLAILDWMMPVMDGIELVRRLRERHAQRSYVYAILLTAKSQKEDIVIGLEAGADDYLTKPFDASELHARVRTGRRILELQSQLLAAQEALREQATHDHLTGVWNRAGILDILQRECSRSARTGSPLSVVMADLDHFKRINDTLGHMVGDEVLRCVAKRMLASVRSYDSIGRYGGEEFVIVLPDIDATSSHQQAERIRQEISHTPIEIPGNHLTVTLSLGVASSGGGRHDDFQSLLRAADAALYRAKAAGRNQTCLARSNELVSPEVTG